jgi:hypothetical protein
MEIFPNIHEIRSVFGDRYIQQYLFVGDRIVLLDAGVLATPEADCRQLRILRVPLCWRAMRGTKS